MAIEEFSGQLDQERQPQVTEFTGELDQGKTSNPLMGGLARILELGGAGAEALQRSSANLRKGMEEAVPALQSKHLTDEAVKERQKRFTDWTQQQAKDIGYEPSTSLAELGDNPLKVVPFVIERVITSSPDMAAAAYAFTPYVMSRANEILNERLKNDGKTYDQATVGDVTAATAGAIGEATLERFATKRILPGGKGVAAAPAAAGIPAAMKRVGKEVGLQGGTESLEELASYGGETIGTKKGFQPAEAGERMLEAGIVGAGLGGGARGAREVYDYAKQPKVEELPPDAKVEPVQPEVAAEPPPPAAPAPVTGKEPWEEIADEFLKKPPVEEKPVEQPLVKPPLEAAGKPIEVPSDKGKIEGVDEIDLNPNELQLSKDVPQFKEEADERGIVEPLKGEKYEYVGTAPIQVWRRLDGTLEVISGRHRWDLAKRTGADRIPAQVFDEAKGFNADMAAIMDAELNIRDGKGKITDYVNYFKTTGDKYGLTEKDYEARGLLDSKEGKRAYTVTVQGSDELIQALRGRQLKEDTAYRIADAVPNDPRLQALGIKLVNEKPLEQAINILHAAKTIEPKAPEMGGDLFGFDDSGLKLAEDMGKLAAQKQKELSEQITAIQGAGRKSDIAKKYGIDVKDPEAVNAKVRELKAERAAWDNWASNPELVDQIRREIAGEPEPVAVEENKEEKALFDDSVKKFYSAAVRHHKAAEIHYSKLPGKQEAAFNKIFDNIQEKYQKLGYNVNEAYGKADDAYGEAMARLRAEEFNKEQQHLTNGRLTVKRNGPRSYTLYEDGKEVASGNFDDIQMAAHEKRAEYQEVDFTKGSEAEDLIKRIQELKQKATELSGAGDKIKANQLEIEIQKLRAQLKKPATKPAAVKIVKTKATRWSGTGFGTKGASYGVEGNPDIMVRRESHGWEAFNKKTKEKYFGSTKAELEQEIAKSTKAEVKAEEKKAKPETKTEETIVDRYKKAYAAALEIKDKLIEARKTGVNLREVERADEEAMAKLMEITPEYDAWMKKQREAKAEGDKVKSVKMRRDPMGTDYLVTLNDGRTAVIYRSEPGGDFGLGAWYLDKAGYDLPARSQGADHRLGFNKKEALENVAKKLDELEKYRIKKEPTKAAVGKEHPNFKKWFGDSKVVDEDGNPMRMYHITKEDFEAFHPGGKEVKEGHPEGQSGTAMWFTPRKEWQPAAHNVGGGDKFREGARVIPVYLKMERPLLIDDKETLDWAQTVFAGGSKEFPQIVLTKWKNELVKEGYDGIIFKRESVNWTDFSDEYVVFNPDQIKSAIGSGYTPGVADFTASFELEPEAKVTPAEKKAAAEREAKEIADREREFFALTPRTPEQGAGNYLQQDMIGAMGLTEAEFKKGIDKRSTDPGEPLILRDVTMSEHESYNNDANDKVDDDIIEQYNGMDNVKNSVPKDDIELTYGKKIDETLSKQAQAIEDYINLSSQGKVTAAEFMKSVREAAARGDIEPDVLNAIENIYKTSPAVLDGIRIEVTDQGNKRRGRYLEVGHYQPLARMIRLFKDTAGVSNASTVRHEIAHTMEQMMTPEQKRMVIRAWRDELMRATRAETTDEGHIFFQNVAKFLHSPSIGTYKNVIKSMPNVSYYQYVNPSEYWAVNAETILKSREASASGLRSMVEKLHQGLKQSFGMSNFWVGNKVFDQILTGDRFSPRMLINYIKETKHRNFEGNKAPLATWDIMGSTALEDWKYNYMDKNIDLFRIQQDIARMSGEVADEIDPYTRETLSHSRISTRMEEFVRDYVNQLAKVMKDSSISQQQLHEYLLARHAPERNRVIAQRNPSMGDMASSISTQDALDYIRSLGDARVEKLNEAAQIIDAMTKKTRDILVDEGYEDAETVASWEKMFKYYVPLFRKDIEYKGGGSGFGSSKGRGKFSQMAAGSLKEVDDIGKNIVMEHLRAIEKVEDARVRRALFALAVKHPNPDFWMPIDPNALKNPEKTIQNLEKMGLSDELIKNLMQPPKAPKFNKETGLIEYVTSDVISKSKNVVAVRIDGQQVYLVLNGSNPRANRLALSIQNMDTKGLEGYLRASAYVTRWFAQVNTQWNPIFGLWNFARDIQGAGLNLSTTELRGHEKEVLKGAFPAAKQIIMAIRQQRKTGKRATTAGAEDFYELGLEGGVTGYKAKFVDPTREKNLLQDAVKDLDRGKPMKIAKYLSDAISDWNDMLENAVRLSAYKTAVANGISKQQAANIAKNLTVNFNRKGAKSQNLGALFAFFNASVQGTVRLGQTLKGPIGKKIVGGGMMLGLLQAGMMALAGFEDDEPPEFVKEKNIIIPLGWITGEKNYLSIPMPLGFNVFPGAGRIMGEALIGAARGDDVGHKFFDIISLIANSFNPLGSTGLSLQTIAPTPLDPFVAISQNKDAFGRPIYKADRETNPQVGYKRTRETTWEGWKAIAEFINYAQGGTEDTKGAFKALDLTGDEISFLVGQATGGVGRDVMKTFGLAKDFVTGDETPTYKIPLIGKLYGNAESQAAEKNRFYANVTKLAEMEQRVKGMRERGENVAEFRREHPETQVMNMANRIENEITQLNKRRNVLIKNGATVEQIKRLEEVKAKKMQMLNDRYNMLRKQ